MNLLNVVYHQLLHQAPLFLAFGSMEEVPMSEEGKLVLYKQVDSEFYPTLSYIISVICINTLIMIPQAIIFSVLVYFLADFVADAGRFFLLLFTSFVLEFLLLMSTSMSDCEYQHLIDYAANEQ
jgi:ABC-type multidrug transport system permease subunit